MALGAEAQFRCPHPRPRSQTHEETFQRAHDHQGASFVEIYQNCNVFNDGQFDERHQEGSATK